MILRPKKRTSTTTLKKIMTLAGKGKPICAKCGVHERDVLPYPPPWIPQTSSKKIPKKYKHQIDHINSIKNDNRPENLQWLCFRHHVVKSREHYKIKRKRLKRAPTINTNKPQL